MAPDDNPAKFAAGTNFIKSKLPKPTSKIPQKGGIGASTSALPTRSNMNTGFEFRPEAGVLANKNSSFLPEVHDEK